MPCASSTSAPSTHPPVTEPSMRPLSSTSISAPGSSGADPIVSTSLAATTRRPSSSHCSATSIERGTMAETLLDLELALGQLALEHLARRVARELVEEDDLARDLVAREVGLDVVLELVLAGVGAVAQHDERPQALAELVVV